VHFEWESAAVHHLPLFATWAVPVVVSCHGAGINVHPHTGEYEHWIRGYEVVFERAAAVHIVSEALRASAAPYGLDPAKTWLIRSAVDPGVFRPGGVSRRTLDAFRIVSVGDLLWLKGHHYSLQAIRALVDQAIPARFDLIGDDPRPETGERTERGALRFTIHDLGLDDRVTLKGALPSLAVRDHLQGADVFLHASVSEGIPTVVLEAMACGLPVVVTDCGGIREVVTDGVEGFVVPRRDVRATASALAALWNDPGLRERMGRAGRERVLADFTLARQLDAFSELYESLVASARPGAPSHPRNGRSGGA
jgi:glycosyltransferase involved in cell wall biosynthesis